jgi:hypothetical protein
MEDAVNWPIVKLCDVLRETFPIILMSGREEKYRDVTEYWLGAHNIFPHRIGLIMREAKDNRPDEVVKRELYERHIKDKYTVVAVLDDRNKVVKMWRDLGLTCLQVAEGDF